MARAGEPVTLQQAAEAIVTHCYDRRHFTREEHITFAQRQLEGAVARGRREAEKTSRSQA